MSLITGELQFPPRRYKTVKELHLPENKDLLNSLDPYTFKEPEEIVHESVEGSEIAKFYEGKSIFVTGGSGFIGKLIIEKLLRSCKGLAKIYILMRPKKGHDISTRWDKMFENVIFSEMKKANPNFRSQIVPVPGDLTDPDLGISTTLRQEMIENVNVIIHSAATVNFDESLRTAAAINVGGTKKIMILAQQCYNLQSLVYVGTAYSNCIHKEIHEILYTPPLSTEEFLKMIETNTDEYLKNNEKKIIKQWPNTYTFTKSIAEDTVSSMCGDIPTSICRPAVVQLTYKEPLRAWTDSFNGDVAATIGIGLGVIRVVLADGEKHISLIPSDKIVNGILAVAYQNQFNQKGKINIYNLTPEETLTVKDYMDLGIYYGLKNPSIHQMWHIWPIFTSNPHVFMFLEYILHFIPALVIDLILFLSGKKMRLMKISNKIHKFTILISYFFLREWRMHNQNTQKLWTSLSEKDRKIFNFSTNHANLDWNEFFQYMMLGYRIYVLKDDIDTIPAAKRRHNRLYYIHVATMVIIPLLVVSLAGLLFRWAL